LPVPSKPFTFVNGAGNLIDATQVNADFDALYNALNPAASGLDKTNMNVAFAKDNVEPAFSGYKTLMPELSYSVGNGTFSVAGTFFFANGGGFFATPTSKIFLRYLDPADYAAGSRTTKYRLRAAIGTNAVAPAANFVFGLYPLTFVPGASGSAGTFTVGAVTAGSTVTFNAPGANSSPTPSVAEFTAPAAGRYAIGIAVSAAVAVNSQVDLLASLDVRQV
jgi:hypothetical protein